MRRLLCLIAAAALLFGGVGWAAASDEASAHRVQLIADQNAVSAGGKVSYHLVYHHVDNKATEQTQLHVKVHEWMEVADRGEAEWDAATATLKWRVKNAKGNGADVFHFQLKVKANAKVGDEYELEAIVDDGSGKQWKSKKAKVKVGNAMHQPFMQGYPDGTFRPEGDLTRAEAAAMVARIEGLRDTDAAEYEDVPRTHWAYEYIRQVSAQGYMVGDGERFRPDAPITRAELVVLMLRLHGVEEAPFPAPFDDAANHWSKHALGTAVALGYLDPQSGGAPGRFRPDVKVERQQAAAWLAIGLQREPLHDGETDVERHYSDVPKTHPFFHWIEEVSKLAHESEIRGEGQERLIRYLPSLTQPL